KTEQTLKEAKKATEQPRAIPGTKKNDNQAEKKSSFKPRTGQASGILDIPKINGEFPIVDGTDADDLEKGVGHYKKSYYPDENGQILLSGHRDTVFRRTG
ncbi:sortase, partial [Acinetobacter baumannii]|uniref:sortase n=1 Tax=Acinetobacter baumannii TaxID=470 RepID=UPI00105926D7